MKIDFSNKTVIVTGGTRGIGSAIVELFQQCNAKIIATGTNNSELVKLNSESKTKNIDYIHLDFDSSDSVQSLLEFLETLGRVDVLVNNAGVNKIDSIHDITDTDWNWINKINLRGPFLLTRAVAKIMKEQNYGRIINVASIFGVVSKEKRVAYSTTKWGLIGLTKAIALDLAPDNILVNVVSPGFVDTELTRRVLGEEGIDELVGKIPQLRLANCKEIAKTVLFLASEHNTYITGQNIIVDGGFTSA